MRSAEGAVSKRPQEDTDTLAHSGLPRWLQEREDRLLEQVIRDGECRNVELWQLNDDANLISLGERSCSHRFKDPEKHPCYLQLNACCMGGSEGH